MIYHITTLKQWQTALEEGVYAPETFATDGFVHCSTDKQVLDVATRLYSHEKEILLLMIDEKMTKLFIVVIDILRESHTNHKPNVVRR